MYSPVIIERFQNLQNAGIITNADAVGQVGSIGSGDLIKIYLRIANNNIVEAKFKSLGGVYTLAASDVVCDLLRDCSLTDALTINSNDIIKMLKGLPENKLYIADLAQAVIADAVEDYHKKIAKLNIKK